MTSRKLMIAVSALFLSTGAVCAAEIDPAVQCNAVGDAFTNYSANKTDPDAAKATALAQEGARDCKDGRYDDGINKVNNAMGMMNDGVDSGRDGRR